MTRGSPVAGPGCTAEAAKRYEPDEALDELRRRAWVLRLPEPEREDWPLRLPEPEREDWLLRLPEPEREDWPLRLPEPEREVFPERPWPEPFVRRELELLRLAVLLEALRLAVPRVVAAPSFAPFTAPRAAAAATSPAFIRPARPYTAPRRRSSLARGETAAAVAAAMAPASRSM